MGVQRQPRGGSSWRHIVPARGDGVAVRHPSAPGPYCARRRNAGRWRGGATGAGRRERAALDRTWTSVSIDSARIGTAGWRRRARSTAAARPCWRTCRCWRRSCWKRIREQKETRREVSLRRRWRCWPLNRGRQPHRAPRHRRDVSSWKHATTSFRSSNCSRCCSWIARRQPSFQPAAPRCAAPLRTRLIAAVLQHHGGGWRTLPQTLGIQRPNLYRKARSSDSTGAGF